MIAVLLSLSKAQDCLTTTEELAELEEVVTDYSILREYVFCEHTVFNIGGFVDYFETAFTGSPMIHLRPNLHIKCGQSGSRANNCLVDGGSIQVDGSMFYGIQNEFLDNVMIQGVTFVSAEKHSVFANKPGNVFFKDCEFRVS